MTSEVSSVSTGLESSVPLKSILFPMLTNMNNANTKNASFFRTFRNKTLKNSDRHLLVGSQMLTEKDRKEILRLASEYLNIPIHGKGTKGLTFGRQNEYRTGTLYDSTTQPRTDLLVLVNASRDGQNHKTHLSIHFPTGKESSNIGPIHVRTMDESNAKRKIMYQARVIPVDADFKVNKIPKKSKAKPNEQYEEFRNNFYQGISFLRLASISEYPYNTSDDSSYDAAIAKTMIWALEQVINEKIRARLINKEPQFPIPPYFFTRPSPTIQTPTIQTEPCGGAGCSSSVLGGKSRRKNRLERKTSFKTRKLAK
jgi:hypothetical protein